MRTALAAALLLLAGCSSPSDSAQDPPNPDAEPATLTLSYATPPMAVDQNVTYTLRIAGPAGTSDHIGGHYWTSSHPDDASATAAFGEAKGCVHVAGGGSYPGTFPIVCNTGAGDHYVRGHLRVTAADGTKTEHWAPETLVTVA